MSPPLKRLSRLQLNQLLIDSLGSSVNFVEDLKAKPLVVDLTKPYPLKLRFYIFNCTNPPGGRSLEEYKIQVILPNQQPRERKQFDYSDGRLAILIAYVRLSEEFSEGVFVLWDATQHEEVAYSANFQVSADTIINALSEPVSLAIRNNNEIVIAARPKYLLAALEMRISKMAERV